MSALPLRLPDSLRLEDAMWSDGEKYKVVEHNGVQYRRLPRSRRKARHANWKRFFLSNISLKLSVLAVFGPVRPFLCEPVSQSLASFRDA